MEDMTMNLALLAQSKAFTTLQRLVCRLVSARRPTPRPPSQYESTQRTYAPGSMEPHATQMRAGSGAFLQHKPLRIVHVLEAGQTQSSVGRMVISGRMADVCAELDRLAAREAALL